ncbi:hypothetical protein AAF712_014685 [Marasmius tenuissimus]|uniref:Uncharacterized protein n=1 Tax=Marasmius tenuissimus TaxID=585030 RepID=A0ABR2ZBM8_9AGAR
MSFLFSKSKSKKRSLEEVPMTNNALAVKSGVSVLVLDALQDVARLAPVPYLSIICSVARWILETVQTFDENKEAYKALGEDTCGVVYAINDTCQGFMKENETWTADLEENLRQLWVYSFRGSLLLESRPMITPLGPSNRFKAISAANCAELPLDITIHEPVRRMSENQQADHGSSTSGAGRENSTFHTTLPGSDSGSFSGNIHVNDVAGNQHNSGNESHSFMVNSHNNGNRAGGHSIGR